MRKLLVCLAPVLVLAGCDFEEWGDSSRYKEEFHQSHALKPGGRLSVENLNGPVEISGWERDLVQIDGTKYASSPELLKSLSIDIVATGDTVRVRTVRPSRRRGGMGASYVIRVPRRTELERIISSNGSLRVEGIESAARLRTSNGSVRVAGLKGSLEAHTSNASVEVRDQQGDATIETSNGSVHAEGIRGAFSATTSNASVSARLIEPQAHSPLRLHSSNGSITLTIERMSDNEIHATTSNASITVRLPAAPNARLSAHTSNSSVQSDFDLTLKGGTVSRSHLEGVLGGGGPLIELSTSNAGIKILKL